MDTGHDGILGTGGGKSLIFLLPAVLADKPTIVVVPTLSLINDLLGRCLALDITACKITGEVPVDIQKSYLEELKKIQAHIFDTRNAWQQNHHGQNYEC